MPHDPRRGIQEHGPTDPDELSLAQERERATWGLPSDEGAIGQHAGEVPNGYDYAAGILVGHGEDADAQAAHAQHLIRARVDTPRGTFEVPHEATHRRYEPPRIAPIAQASAGYTLIAPANFGLHYVKLIACFITLDAAGTLKFVQGGDGGGGGISSSQGGGDLSGLMNLGGASAPALQLPPSGLENPWLFTAPDQPLGIFTVTGKAQGWAVYAYSPYDQ